MKIRSLLIILTILLPTMAIATDWEISRLASKLDFASSNLATEAKNVRGFSSVSHNARQLSKKAQQLTDSIAKRRSSAYINNRFTDVSRYYQRLETAFLRASNSNRSRYASHDFDQIARLYDNLRYQFYGDGNYLSFRSMPPAYQPYFQQPDYPRQLNFNAPGVVVRPPLNNGQDAQHHRGGRQDSRHRNDYDHRSSVIERQRRRNDDRYGNNDRGERGNTKTRRNNQQQGNLGSYRLGQ